MNQAASAKPSTVPPSKGGSNVFSYGWSGDFFWYCTLIIWFLLCNADFIRGLRRQSGNRISEQTRIRRRRRQIYEIVLLVTALVATYLLVLSQEDAFRLECGLSTNSNFGGCHGNSLEGGTCTPQELSLADILDHATSFHTQRPEDPFNRSDKADKAEQLLLHMFRSRKISTQWRLH